MGTFRGDDYVCYIVYSDSFMGVCLSSNSPRYIHVYTLNMYSFFSMSNIPLSLYRHMNIQWDKMAKKEYSRPDLCFIPPTPPLDFYYQKLTSRREI